MKGRVDVCQCSLKLKHVHTIAGDVNPAVEPKLRSGVTWPRASKALVLTRSTPVQPGGRRIFPTGRGGDKVLPRLLSPHCQAR